MLTVQGNEIDLLKMGLLAAWGLTVLIVFFHASYGNQNLLVWTIIAIALPGLGMIIYFLFYFMYSVEKTARHARVHQEQHWEFKLTDKGKRIDPNLAEGEKPVYKPKHGHSKEVIDISPPSQDIIISEPEEEPRLKHGHLPGLIDESPLSRDVKEPGQDE